jgi:hypothetical protein
MPLEGCTGDRCQPPTSIRFFSLYCHAALGRLLVLFNPQRTMRSRLCILVRDWRAALLLVAVACATPQRASAECGGYVTIHNAPSAATRHAMPPIGKEPDVPAPARTPCQGPNCSDAPSRNLPPVPVLPVSQHVKEHATCQVLLGAAEPPHRSLDCDTSFSRPVRRASIIFHPPRRAFQQI